MAILIIGSEREKETVVYFSKERTDYIVPSYIVATLLKNQPC